MSASTLSKGNYTIITTYRFRLNNSIKDLLNNSSPTDFEELMFWGRIEGLKAEYYICMGVTFTDKYEFPSKCFYWASSNDFKFKPFPSLNEQHNDKVDTIVEIFSGDANKIYIRVEKEVTAEEAEAETVAKETKPVVEKDPLASTEEEDPNAGFVPRNFTELDRLQFTVLAIENDCHILPKGSVKLTELHEVRRNNAFRGLNETNGFDISSYSHFRNVQNS